MKKLKWSFANEKCMFFWASKNEQNFSENFSHRNLDFHTVMEIQIFGFFADLTILVKMAKTAKIEANFGCQKICKSAQKCLFFRFFAVLSKTAVLKKPENRPKMAEKCGVLKRHSAVTRQTLQNFLASDPSCQTLQKFWSLDQQTHSLCSKNFWTHSQ